MVDRGGSHEVEDNENVLSGAEDDQCALDATSKTLKASKKMAAKQMAVPKDQVSSSSKSSAWNRGYVHCGEEGCNARVKELSKHYKMRH